MRCADAEFVGSTPAHELDAVGPSSPERRVGMYVTHRATGVHRIPDEWLDGFAPSGFRRATPAEIAAWHEERGLTPLDGRDAYCPHCLRRIPTTETHCEVGREVCASGTVEVVLHRCSICGTALAAQVLAADLDGA
jgi:hypothetical protein